MRILASLSSLNECLQLATTNMTREGESGQFYQSPGVHSGLQQATAQVALITAMNLKIIPELYFYISGGIMH